MELAFKDNVFDPMMHLLPENIMLRALVTGCIAWAISYATNPGGLAYNPDGSQRPWAVAPQLPVIGVGRGRPTYWPWWMWAVVGSAPFWLFW